MPSFYDRRAILVASTAALAVVLLGVSLGLWQLRRAGEKAATQAAMDRAVAAPARVLDAGEGGAGREPLPPAATIDGSRVQAIGVFDAGRSVFLDNRSRKGVAGLHVLTPLRLSGSGGYVVVLRGWVARDPIDRNRLPEIRTPSGPVRIEGIATADFQQPMLLGEDPVPGTDDRLWQHFSFEKFARWYGAAPYPLIVRQTVEPGYRDDLARDWNSPGMSAGRHQAYAFQWFAMTACAIVIWLILMWRRRQGAGVVRVSESN